MQATTPRLVLASASRARAALLSSTGLRFEAKPARIDEEAVKQSAQAEGAPASETAILLAGMKARRVALAAPDAVVIGADQILVCDGRWFNKPETEAAARAQLAALRGRAHDLVTALVCQRGDRRIWHHVATPRLTMRPFSDAFLDDYLAAEGATVTESVGAYRLEGAGIQLFDRVDGDFFSVLGLPLLPLLGFLRQHGVLNA